MGRVFVVEDDTDQCDLLAFSLRRSGHRIKVAQTGSEALAQVCEFDPEVVIMDVMLPDTTGFELCTRFKHITDAPILLFSAVRVSEEDRVRGLTGGAQDYLTKSYSHRELLARIHNLLNLKPESTVLTMPLQEKHLKVLLVEQRVLLDTQEIPLTATEFKLLVLLMRSSGKVLTYREIALALWNVPTADSTMIKSCFSRLRAKFKYHDVCDKVFRTVPRRGYSLIPLPAVQSPRSKHFEAVPAI